MDAEVWAAFAVASLLLAIIPGPGVATIIGFALSSGRPTALASVAGMAVGNAIAITFSLAGAGVVLAASALAFTVLKWLGAIYLIGIGTLAVIRAGSADKPGASPAPMSPRAAFLTTVAVGVFHPKTIIFFIAFAAQFVTADAPFLPQAAILVVTFTAIAAISDTLYALVAARAGERLKGAAARAWTRRAGGGVMILAGVATAAMQR